MKITKNISAVIKLAAAVMPVNKYVKEINKAKASGDYDKEREYILKCSSYFGPRIINDLGVDFHVHGEENLPTEGPVVFMSNHQGYADIIAMLAAINTIPFGFVAKKQLGAVPILGKWIIRIRSVFINRDDARASLEAIQEGVNFINDGFSLCIFPEGTRSRGPVPGKFMRGAIKLATKPGVPIIPVSINGTYLMMEETGAIEQGTRIDIIIHEPIPTAGIGRSEERELMEKIEKIIVDGVASLQQYQEH